MNKTKNNTLISLWSLVKRNIKIYLNDRMMVFFSLLAPIIVLLLYILFFTDMQMQAIELLLKDPEFAGITLTSAQIRGVINNWMIAGVLGISCITVSFNANTIMVRDRQYGNVNDVLASPVKRWVIYASYVLSCFIITLTICAAVFVIAAIYLACTGGFMMSFVDFLAIVGTLILSTISAALFCTLFIGFIKSEGALTAVCGVFSAIIGFLVGAYLPMNMMPSAINYISCFIPGSYSVGLFRTIFLRGPIEQLIGKVPENVLQILTSQYSLEMDFFGMKVTAGWMILVLVISIVIFSALLLIFYTSKKTNFFAPKTARKKNKVDYQEIQKIAATSKNKEIKIPKVIHYVWVGGKPKPESVLKCIESWKKFCPDYEIKEWNETNFDINSVPFVKEAIECKKYAFAADYIRMYALYNEGGIYMDTDNEVTKPMDRFLVHRAFSGFENKICVAAAPLGCEKQHPLFKLMLDYYQDRHFLKNGKMDMVPNVKILTAFLIYKFGMANNNTYQELKEGIAIYPKDWFHPKNYITGEIENTPNTHGIHHFAGTWLTQANRRADAFMRFISHCMPKKWFEKMNYSYEKRAYKKFYKNFVKNYLEK